MFFVYFNRLLWMNALGGKRRAQIIGTKTAKDWSRFLSNINNHWASAQKITLVMDNLNTHTAGSLYETLPPAQAKALLERFEFIYTPKHGSWLNMAEIEINSLIQQCLNRRIGDIEEMRTEVTAWQREQNQAAQMIRWHFTTDDARIKLHRLYPTFED